MRRFEVTAVAFLVFNAACAVLALREYRSLLIACNDYSGPPGDCVEPYSSLGVVFIVGAWLVGGLVLAGLGAAFYIRGVRRLSRANST